ncbi:signal peptidase I [Romboutsia sp.]|uniref:signal peptidase I n=1 Tax=Romboutsia sp. TaxID=1965302 RepID=UPI003F2ED9C8
MQSQNQVKRKKRIKPSTILNTILAITLTILVLNMLTTKSDKIFKIIGYRTYTVLSGSMEPEVYPGDTVVIKHTNKTDIQVNDVVTYTDDEGVVITHRIIEQTDEGYITKGDNNNVQDSDIITSKDIIGKVVFSIPKAGFVIQFLSQKWVITVEMILLGIFIIIYSKNE